MKLHGGIRFLTEWISPSVFRPRVHLGDEHVAHFHDSDTIADISAMPGGATMLTARPSANSDYPESARDVRRRDFPRRFVWGAPKRARGRRGGRRDTRLSAECTQRLRWRANDTTSDSSLLIFPDARRTIAARRCQTGKYAKRTEKPKKHAAF